MKKVLLLLTVLAIVISMAACKNSGKDNGKNDDFDTSKVTFTSAYQKAQNLGFEGTLEEFIELISGEDGEDGKDGEDGVGIVTVLIDEGNNLLVILSNGNTINCGKVKGADGKDGVEGAPGKDGEDGKDGIDGKPGEDGKTPTFKIESGILFVSYDNGSTWAVLGNIQGADGEDGKDGVDGAPGKDGEDGTDGITPTIEISEDGYWVINGVKTEYKAIGVDGSNGVDGENGKDGVDGAPGKDGEDGKDGNDGKDGVTPAFKIENGELLVSYDNGSSWISLGNVQGADGEDGKDGTNGSDGKDGENGANGSDGKDGVDGITPTFKIENGELLVSYDNGNSWTSLGNVQGADGEDGKDGTNGSDGKDGVDGAPGEDGKTPTIEISEDGYWVINGVKTEYKAIGVDGSNGTDGTNGTDGVTPTIEISEDGYWVINGVKSNVKAEAVNGDKGETGATIEKVEFDEEGRLVITLTNGTVLDPIELPKKEEHVHTYGDWNVYGTPTNNCENNIYYTVCYECNYIEFKLGDSDSHVWNDCESFDLYIHWLECANCEATKDHESHIYDNACDTECNFCGAYTPIYAHVYDSDVCDVDCNICGEIRLDPHVWDSICDAICDRCGEERIVPDHVYDNACDAYCNVCGGVRTPAEHIYDDEFDAFCNECGERRDIPYTWGLEYALDPDETGYMVIGIGEATDTEIIIPKTYNGLPVTMIRARAFEFCRNITSVTIPNTVVAIGGYAFRESGITEIIIPDSVVTMGDHAFYACSELTSVTIGNGLTVINDWTFYSCDKLTNVTFGDNITTIGRTFPNCHSISCITIPDTVIEISAYAFESCNSLTSITIGTGASKIDSRAFYNCTSLTGIVVAEGNDTYKSIDGNLYSKDGKALIKYAAGKQNASFTLPAEVEHIGESAFENSNNLVRIIIGDNLESIDSSAFWYCPSLIYVYYTGSQSAWNNVKVNNTQNDAIKNAIFTYNYCIHEYSSECDTKCDKCSEERLPKAEHVYSSDCDAYCNDCYEERESALLHSYDNECDAYCNLCNAYRTVSDHVYDNNCDSDCNVCNVKRDTFGHDAYAVIDEAIEPTCTESGLTEGKHCSSCGEVIIAQEIVAALGHTEVIIPAVEATCTAAGLTEGKYCSVCDKIITAQEVVNTLSHTEAIIPAVEATCTATGLTEGKYCSVCDEIITAQEVVNALGHTEAIIPAVEATCTATGLTEGKYCSVCDDVLASQLVINTKDHTYANGNCTGCGKSYYSIDLAFTPSGNSYTVTGIGNCTDTDIVIPLTYNDLPVTAIAEKAFYQNTKIKSVIIPDCVTEIGDEAFAWCSSIKTVYIGTGVTEIGYKIFTHCTSLSDITINGPITYIGFDAFRYCSSLEEFDIPDTVTFIDGFAFSHTGLKSIVIPASVSFTADNYYFCTDQFAGCTKLTSVIFEPGSKITVFPDSLFNGCISLTEVIIPKSVKTIGTYVFSNCPELKKVYYGGRGNDWSNVSIDSFNPSLESATLYYYVETTPTEYSNYWHYVNGKPAIWPKYEG